MEIGTVERLWRYPVKSLAPVALDAADVAADGFAGDRTATLVVASPGHARTGKTYRGKENDRLHLVADADAGRELAAAAGVQVELVRGARYFDARPVSLLFDTWVGDVEALTGIPIDPLRFRPNIYARAGAGFTAREADCVGATFEFGAVVLTVIEPNIRCVTTTYDVETAAREPAVLREVAAHRSAIVGVYCAVVRTGTIRCGARITASGGLPALSRA